MKKYIPETGWEIEGNLIYNLKKHIYNNGKQVMANDVAVSIEARDLPEKHRDDIAKTIMIALNKKYYD